jgi:site-specific DNA recombinase
MMNAVIYARVSTNEAPLSLTTQLRVCREYCEGAGYEVAAIFADVGESAKTTNRPELLRLFEFCRANEGKVQSVAVADIARLTRNSNDLTAISALFQRLGISVCSPCPGTV